MPGKTPRIQIAISAAPYTGHQRVAQLKFFGIDEQLQMLQQIRVVHVDGKGTPIHELIEADESLTDSQKQVAKAQYPEREVTRTTEGAWVNPQTGGVMAEGTPGAVAQLAFFQAITVEQMLAMTGTTTMSSFAEVLYAMLGGEIQKIDARGGL